ncbi:LysR family transcriptional regulator [Micromonospora deserti]|uniref:LysR family transcriptional regulator n=1 Tax=Micromonospora deserti TaxID=2070366 RepID=UPI001314B5DF|nr:LysR family transcriptional regulator [Micromonospora deserti]
MIEIRDLALFLEVVESGSISAGAERCGLSLSAASARITALERRVGTPLLERHRRGASPTAAGESLTAGAARLVDEARELEESLMARSRGITQELRLAVNSSAVDSLPEVITAALNRMQTVSLDLVELSSVAAVDHVREGRVELAVVSTGTAATQGCETIVLWDDSLVVVGRPQKGLSRPLSLAQVTAEPMVGLNRGVPLQQLIERQAARAALQPTYRVRFPSLGAVCAAATAGVGRAIVPRNSARRYGVPLRAQHELTEPWARREAVLVARDFARLSPTAAALTEQFVAYGAEVEV